MDKKNRYNTTGLVEDMYEPGSRGRVLKNIPGITGKRVMDEMEAREHLRALSKFLEIFEREHRFMASDICHMHKIWMGGIYQWAGNYRQVNISKEGFAFAMAGQIPKLMEQFEQGPLTKFTPCIFTDQTEILHAIALTHTELVLIHPFREGNGRLARMLSVIMGLQAGLPPFDFSMISGKIRQDYFAAIQAGMRYDYKPMENIFRIVLKKTLGQVRGD